jgi:ribosomal protein L30/L7E
VKEVEIPLHDNSAFYSLRTRRIGDKVVVEVITSPDGKIATAKELVRDTKLTLDEVRSLIDEAHSRKEIPKVLKG